MKNKTIDYYNNNAEQYNDRNPHVDFWSKEFNIFQDYLPSGRVLEVGCGAGRDTTFLAKHYDYIGIDPSAGMLKIAKAKWPDSTFIEATADNLPFNDNEFDGFWAAASLLHIKKDKINYSLQEIRRVVKDCGYGFISIKKGNKAKDIKVGKYERFFQFYEQDEFIKILKDNNFDVLYKDMIDRDYNPPKDITIWLTFIVKINK